MGNKTVENLEREVQIQEDRLRELQDESNRAGRYNFHVASSSGFHATKREGNMGCLLLLLWTGGWLVALFIAYGLIGDSRQDGVEDFSKTIAFIVISGLAIVGYLWPLIRTDRSVKKQKAALSAAQEKLDAAKSALKDM